MKAPKRSEKFFRLSLFWRFPSGDAQQGDIFAHTPDVSPFTMLAFVLLLAPIIGGVGVAIASASALAATNLISVYAVYKKLGLVTIPGVDILLRGKNNG